MTKVYVASPFFNQEEIGLVNRVAAILKEKGLQTFLPMENQLDHLEAGSRHWSIEIFMNDLKFINWADIVVAIYHGNYSDSGTAWELGYAYAHGKPVIVVHVGENSNLMVHEGAHANLTLEQLENYDFNKMESSFYTGDMF